MKTNIIRIHVGLINNLVNAITEKIHGRHTIVKQILKKIKMRSWHGCGAQFMAFVHGNRSVVVVRRCRHTYLHVRRGKNGGLLR